MEKMTKIINQQASCPMQKKYSERPPKITKIICRIKENKLPPAVAGNSTLSKLSIIYKYNYNSQD